MTIRLFNSLIQNRYVRYISGVLLVTWSTLFPFETLDTIKVVIIGKAGTAIITQSDIERPNLNGEMRSLDDIIFEEQVMLDAQSLDMSPDEKAVDQYLMSIQKENDLTDEQLKTIFTSSGYTYEEGRALLCKMQTINMAIDFKVRSRIIVTRKEIEEYIDAHPEYEDAAFQLSYALVPFSSESHQQQRSALKKSIENGTADIAWSDPFWIKESEIAQEKYFITTMEPHSVVIAGKTEDGFELYQLHQKKDAKLRSLDERYDEVTTLLQRPKYEALIQQYRDKLLRESTIIYMD